MIPPPGANLIACNSSPSAAFGLVHNGDTIALVGEPAEATPRFVGAGDPDHGSAIPRPRPFSPSLTPALLHRQHTRPHNMR